MARGMHDRFANIISGRINMAAANTEEFQEILTGISLGQGVGILLDQIDYYFGSAPVEMTVNGDFIRVGWYTTNTITDLGDTSDRRILHFAQKDAATFGTVATQLILDEPIVHQFFPPIIFAGPRLYFGVDTLGLASAALLMSRLYFRFIELTAQEYLEIAETFQLTG